MHKLPRICTILLLPVLCLPAQEIANPEIPVPDLADIITLDTFEVRATRDTDYLSEYAESATRLDIPIADIPQSVLVFNQEFITDLNALTLDDVVMFDPSLTTDGNDNINIRGQVSGGNYYNGFEQATGMGAQPLASIARVEIIKGPSAILYGTGAFGGIVNRVPKKPLFKRQIELRATSDHFGLYTAAADINEPLSKKAALRLNLSWTDGKQWGDFPRRVLVAAPSFLWNISRRTSLTVEAIYQREEGLPTVFAFPVWGGNPEKISVKSFEYNANGVLVPGPLIEQTPDLRSPITEPDDDDIIITRALLYTDFRHQLSRFYALRLMVNGEFNRRDLLQTMPGSERDANRFDPSLGYNRVLLNRYARDWSWDSLAIRSRLELTGFQKTGPFDHKFILGGSYNYQYRDEIRYISNNAVGTKRYSNLERYPSVDWITGERISVANNGAMTVIDSVGSIASYINYGAPDLDAENSLRQWSVYANDFCSLIPGRLILALGIRYMSAERTATRHDRDNPGDNYGWVRQDAVTHNIGLVWHILKNRRLTAYINHAQSFDPNWSMDFENDDDVDEYTLLKPKRGTINEVGLRYSIDKKISALLCAYDLLEENVAESYTYEYTNSLGETVIRTRRRTIDGIQSRGVEFSANWRPTPAISIMAGYAYTDAKNKDTGKRHYRVPEHSVSFQGRYVFRTGTLKGLSANLGLIWRDGSIPQESTLSTSRPMWTIPSYVDLSLGLYYDWRLTRKHTLRLSVRGSNLTNNLNYRAASSRAAALQDPRKFTFNTSLKF